jgi:hypothetical protein
LRPGDLRGAGENEQQRQKGAADDRNDMDGHRVFLGSLPDGLTGSPGSPIQIGSSGLQISIAI